MSTSPPPFSERKETFYDRYRRPTGTMNPPVCSPQLALHRREPAERLAPTFRCSHFSEERSDNLLIKHPNKSGPVYSETHFLVVTQKWIIYTP